MGNMGEARRHRRRSIRLPGHDYAGAGAYFVTVCTDKRRLLFGDVVGGHMRLNPLGKIVSQCWSAIADHVAHVSLDAFVIMPNHVHGVLLLTEHSTDNDPHRAVGAQHAAPLRAPIAPVGSIGRVSPGSLAAIVRSFKSASTRQINLLRATPGAPVWQRNNYEHVIRHDDDLPAIRRYIAENPLRWSLDDENPHRVR